MVWGTDGRLRATIPLDLGREPHWFDPLTAISSERRVYVQPRTGDVVGFRWGKDAKGDWTEVVARDADTGRTRSTVRLPDYYDDLEFTSDGRRWAGARGHSAEVVVLDTRTGREVFTTPARKQFARPPTRFSPDDRMLAVGGDDGRLVLFECATGRERVTFTHIGNIGFGSIVFSPDGRWLVAHSAGDPFVVWDVHGELDRPKNPPDVAALEKAWADLASEDAKAGFVAVRLMAAFPKESLAFLREKTAPDGLRAVRAVEAVEWMATPDAVKLLERWAGGAAGSRLADEAKAALARLRR